MKPYGCSNNPRPVVGAVTHVAQAGWRDTVDYASATPTRVPIMVDVVHRFESGCQYDKSGTDPGCAECKHAKKEAPCLDQ